MMANSSAHLPGPSISFQFLVFYYKIWRSIVHHEKLTVITKITTSILSLSLFLCSSIQSAELPDIGLATDPAPSEIDGELKANSHVKLFLPNLPYLAVSHAVNASLVRPANNPRGWQYDLAISHRNVDDKIWEFDLRQDVLFQDGSVFNADSVIQNLSYFKDQPFTFSNIHNVFDRAEKLSEFTVRIYLTEAYGAFLHDAIWMQFYTTEYLQKFGWNGKPTCPNLAEPGLYGLGPYILVEGYLEGDRRTPKVVLKANPLYWGDNKPKVETITIFTDLDLAEAKDMTLYSEEELDITPLSFADEVAAVLSPFAKLAISPSMNSYAMHFNMINGNEALMDDRIRYAINHAIDQEYLLNLSLLGEGVMSPTMVSPNFYKVGEAIDSLEDYFTEYAMERDDSIENLRLQVQAFQEERGMDSSAPLKLTLLTQESFGFLTREIEYFLAQINIELTTNTSFAEEEVFGELFSTWKESNQQEWDLLLWGNYDWFTHPWSAFFVYRPLTDWSSIPANEELVALTNNLLRINTESDDYVRFIANFIRHVYENNYMVFLPTPNNAYAVNKEVVFTPGLSAFISLRDLQVTDLHWSVRGDNPYPPERKIPLNINREISAEVTQ